MPLQSDLDALPKTLQFVATKPLFVLRLGVGPLQIVGATPAASAIARRTVPFTACSKSSDSRGPILF